MIDCDIIFFYFSGIMKFNSDGNLLFTKTFSNSFSNNKLEIKYFLFGWIQKYNDLMIMNGKVGYDQSALGFSSDSYIDQIVLTVDGGFNIKLASIFDYKLRIDTKNDFIIYEDIIYISDYAANYYPCFSVWMQQMERIYNPIYLHFMQLRTPTQQVARCITLFRNKSHFSYRRICVRVTIFKANGIFI